MPQRPLAASANLGDNDVLDMESWVAKGQLDHLDIVVFGLQESKYFKAPSGNQPGTKGAASGAAAEPLRAGDYVEELAALMARGGNLSQPEAERVKEIMLLHKDSPAITPTTTSAGATAAEVPEPPVAPTAATASGAAAEEPKPSIAPTGHAATTGSGGIIGKRVLWEIDKHVGSEFFLLKSVQIVQMMVRVYIRHPFKGKVSEVETGAENTGFAGVGFNKGGQAVKFVVENTSFVFVNSHLAAHETAEKCNERNKNAEEIFNGVRFGDQRFDFCQFDHVFWFGDLNYRCEPPPSVVGGASVDEEHRRSVEAVMKLVEADDFASLWKMDELQREVTAGRVYANFKTPPCEFKPTFKVHTNFARSFCAICVSVGKMLTGVCLSLMGAKRCETGDPET